MTTFRTPSPEQLAAAALALARLREELQEKIAAEFKADPLRCLSQLQSVQALPGGLVLPKQSPAHTRQCLIVHLADFYAKMGRSGVNHGSPEAPQAEETLTALKSVPSSPLPEPEGFAALT